MNLRATQRDAAARRTRRSPRRLTLPRGRCQYIITRIKYKKQTLESSIIKNMGVFRKRTLTKASLLFRYSHRYISVFTRSVAHTILAQITHDFYDRYTHIVLSEVTSLMDILEPVLQRLDRLFEAFMEVFADASGVFQEYQSPLRSWKQCCQR